MTKIIEAAKIKSSSMLDKYLGTPSITGRAHLEIFSSIKATLMGVAKNGVPNAIL